MFFFHLFVVLLPHAASDVRADEVAQVGDLLSEACYPQVPSSRLDIETTMCAQLRSSLFYSFQLLVYHFTNANENSNYLIRYLFQGNFDMTAVEYFFQWHTFARFQVYLFPLLLYPALYSNSNGCYHFYQQNRYFVAISLAEAE